jgi:hypothetical protein
MQEFVYGSLETVRKLDPWFCPVNRFGPDRDWMLLQEFTARPQPSP